MSDLMRLARAAAAGRRSSTESEATPTETASTTAKDATTPTGACATCAHYRAKPGQTPDGWCARHKVETWGAYSDGCADDWTPATENARVLERRRAEVIARLKADTKMRYSFEVQGASPAGPAQTDVLVLLGLRDSTGRIVTGELRVPANRWQGLALFAEYWRQATEGWPS